MVREDAGDSRQEKRKEEPQNDREENFQDNNSVRTTEQPVLMRAGRWIAVKGMLPEKEE